MIGIKRSKPKIIDENTNGIQRKPFEEMFSEAEIVSKTRIRAFDKIYIPLAIFLFISLSTVSIFYYVEYSNQYETKKQDIFARFDNLYKGLNKEQMEFAKNSDKYKMHYESIEQAFAAIPREQEKALNLYKKLVFKDKKEQTKIIENRIQEPGSGIAPRLFKASISGYHDMRVQYVLTKDSGEFPIDIISRINSAIEDVAR